MLKKGSNTDSLEYICYNHCHMTESSFSTVIRIAWQFIKQTVEKEHRGLICGLHGTLSFLFPFYYCCFHVAFILEANSMVGCQRIKATTMRKKIQGKCFPIAFISINKHPHIVHLGRKIHVCSSYLERNAVLLCPTLSFED